MMTRIQVKELSEKISEVLRNVEQGERYVVTKEETAIAEIVPIGSISKLQGWKRTINKVTLKPGPTIQQLIEEEREED